MTNDEIIRLAREAGGIPIHKQPKEVAVVGNEAVERFAALVAAAEREECAKIADSRMPGQRSHTAEAIRARSQS